MNETSNRAGNETKPSSHGKAKGITKVLLLTTAAGAISGVILFGLTEWFPAVVLPHGGWEHVNWNLGGEFGLKGGAIGLAIGALITVVRRVFRA